MRLTPNRLRSQTGASLVSTMFAVVLLAMAALGLSQIMLGQRISEVSSDRSDRAHESVVRIVLNLHRMGFGDLVDYCQKSGALEKTRFGTCVDNGQITATGSSLAMNRDLGLEQPMSGDSSSSEEAPWMCVELSSCQVLAGGRVLQLNLTEYWLPNGQASTVQSRVRSIRKAR